MFSFLLVIQILVSISIIALVMLQHGKGADMGAAFGSGAAGTVFGSSGGSFLTRATAILAAIFFVNCLLIASPLVRHKTDATDSVVKTIEQQQAKQAAEQPAAAEGAKTAEVKAEAAAGKSDLPETPDVTPANHGTGDLPE